MESIGFIGVGTIAAAMVHGLRARWPDLRMHLSPRSAGPSQALADADPRIHRAPSNAAVVEASGIVVLSMLPAQLDAVVRGLPFRSDQIVVSCVARTPLADLATLVAPARICRLVPLPMIARREGPIVLYPALPAVKRLFADLGDLVIPTDENGFATFAAGSAVMSTFFTLEEAVAGWMTGSGADPEPASRYVRSLFQALAETGRLTEAADVHRLVERHETPGGLNERVRRALEGQGWFAAPGEALDGLNRLQRGDLAGDGETR